MVKGLLHGRSKTVPLANSICCQDLRWRRLIAVRRHAASRLRDRGDLVLLRLLHPGSAAGERTAARFSSRRRSRCTYPREGLGWSLTKFRLCTARSGGEDRQLAEAQRFVPVPAVARAAEPACPWPARGASWIRDNTPRMTSYERRKRDNCQFVNQIRTRGNHSRGGIDSKTRYCQ